MKASYLLECLIASNINCAHVGVINVPEEGEKEWEQNEGWWQEHFGNYPPCPISDGKYMYFCESDMEQCDLYDERGAYYAPDTTIEIPVEHGFDYIYLFKIDE